MQIKIYYAITAIFMVLAGSCQSFKQKLAINTMENEFYEKVDSIIIHKMNQYDIPGLAIGVVRKDSIIYTKGYGVKKIGLNETVNANSLFHTASISKLFTAIAVMQLVNNNVLALNDRLVDIIPNLNYKDDRIAEITIKQLLNHTSGLPNIHNYHWNRQNQSDSSLRTYIYRKRLKVSTQPGTSYNYSNLAYDILGFIIEKKTGMLFENFIKSNVLEPAQMNNSDFRYYSLPDSLKVYPHSKRILTGNIYTRKVYPYTREHAPSSTLNSTARELSNWMVTFMQDLKNNNNKSVCNKMLKPSFSNNQGIGLGFQLYQYKTYKAIGHFGGDKGFRSFIMMIPEKNIGLVLLGNCDYNEEFRKEIIFSITELILTNNDNLK